MVDRDTVLTAGTYAVDRPLVVREAVLTLEPGTHLVFSQGMGLLVERGGGLLALGDSLNPVILEGDTWTGIQLTAQEAGSRLSYCVIRGAGMPAALQVYSSGRSALVHSEIRQNAGFGVFLARNARLQEFHHNRIQENGWYPVLCQDLESLENMDSTNLLGQGDRSGIWVDQSVEVRRPQRFRLGFQNPLHIDGDLWIRDTLRLENTVLRVQGQVGVAAGGVFWARQVRLEPLQEHWGGVDVAGGILRWRQVVLLYAGSLAQAAVRVRHGSPGLLWCGGTIVEPGGSGLDLATPPDSLWEVQVLHAGAVPVVLRNARILASPLRLDLTQNPSPWIKVTSATVTESDTWRSPGAPVVFTGNVVLSASSGTPVELYLLPGLELRFYEYAGFLVGSQGPARLVARGVRFTSRDLEDPKWRSLRFGPETLEGTRLDSCVLEYGGHVYTQADSGIVVITDTQAPVLRGNVFRYSHTFGVYLRGSANEAAYRQEILQHNEFMDNALGDVGP